jgi:hypothetical protein
MAVYQTDYSAIPAKGLKGQIANEEAHNHVSRTVQGAAGIRFGAPAARGTIDHTVIPFAASTKFIGLAVLTGAVPPVATGSTLVDGYPQDFTGAFMTDGTMFVESGNAVTAGDPVYYNTVTDQYVNAAGTNIVGPIPAAFFDTSATAAGQMVEVSLKHRSA